MNQYGSFRPKSKVSGLWGKVRFICDSCSSKDSSKELELISSGGNQYVSYCCPGCGLKVSYFDTEKVIENISNIILEDLSEDSSVSILGFNGKFLDKKNGNFIYFKVVEKTKDSITISLKRKMS